MKTDELRDVNCVVAVVRILNTDDAPLPVMVTVQGVADWSIWMRAPVWD